MNKDERLKFTKDIGTAIDPNTDIPTTDPSRITTLQTAIDKQYSETKTGTPPAKPIPITVLNAILGTLIAGLREQQWSGIPTWDTVTASNSLYEEFCVVKSATGKIFQLKSGGDAKIDPDTDNTFTNWGYIANNSEDFAKDLADLETKVTTLESFSAKFDLTGATNGSVLTSDDTGIFFIDESLNDAKQDIIDIKEFIDKFDLTNVLDKAILRMDDKGVLKLTNELTTAEDKITTLETDLDALTKLTTVYDKTDVLPDSKTGVVLEFLDGFKYRFDGTIEIKGGEVFNTATSTKICDATAQAIKVYIDGLTAPATPSNAFGFNIFATKIESSIIKIRPICSAVELAVSKSFGYANGLLFNVDHTILSKDQLAEMFEYAMDNCGMFFPINRKGSFEILTDVTYEHTTIDIYGRSSKSFAFEHAQVKALPSGSIYMGYTAFARASADGKVLLSGTMTSDSLRHVWDKASGSLKATNYNTKTAPIPQAIHSGGAGTAAGLTINIYKAKVTI